MASCCGFVTIKGWFFMLKTGRQNMKKGFSAVALAAAMVAGSLVSSGAAIAATPAVPKVIIDSDFNTMGDDGQLFAMASQLMAQGKIKLLGLTVVTGNGWLLQEQAEALKAVERMGVEKTVGVYGGAAYPLHYDVNSINAQKKSNPNGYFGAWMYPQPKTAADVTAPKDGFATHTKLQAKSATDFLIDSIRKNPHQVTVLEIGPPTNLALALKKAPDIAPLIKQIIYMGGAMEVAGNANAVGELNWWFDPQAANEVLHAKIPQVAIPLDVTNTVLLDKKTFDRITADPKKQTAVTRVYAAENAQSLDQNTHIYDTLTIAYLLDPSYATASTKAWVSVDTRDGETQGQVVLSKSGPTANSSQHPLRYVTKFDNQRFFDLYVDLLTRPVPVVLPKK
jgi:purine nucleosidase